MVLRATTNDSETKEDSSGAAGGFFSRMFGGSSTSTESNSSISSNTSPVSSDHETSKPAIPQDVPSLKNIKTPHEDPISHPELAFTPSEIGIWEINKEKGNQGKKGGFGGFWS